VHLFWCVDLCTKAHVKYFFIILTVNLTNCVCYSIACDAGMAMNLNTTIIHWDICKSRV